MADGEARRRPEDEEKNDDDHDDHDDDAVAELEPTTIAQLPAVILGSIFLNVSDVYHLVSISLVCRQFHEAAKNLPLRVRLQPRSAPASKSLEPIPSGGSDDGEWLRVKRDPESLWIHSAVTGISKLFPSTVELDISGTNVSDHDLRIVLKELKALETLVLNKCQKLTSHLYGSFLFSPPEKLRILSLQRCFSLQTHFLADVFTLSKKLSANTLNCVLLSHLDCRNLHPGSDLSISFGLRVLAVTNCTNLNSDSLQVLCNNCPNLQLLMLGGSHEGFQLISSHSEDTRVIADAVSAFLTCISKLPRLKILDVTFFGTPFVPSLQRETGSSLIILDASSKRTISELVPIFSSFSSVEYTPADAFLKGTYLRESDLHHAFEMQFPQTQDRTAQIPIITENIPCSQSPQHQQHQLLLPREPHQHQQLSPNASSNPIELECLIKNKLTLSFEYEDEVVRAVTCAVNCTGHRRNSPIHMASINGDHEHVAYLLSFGSDVNARNGYGSTPFFLASELNHWKTLQVLLKGGAHISLANNAEESPLYIASLKGNILAVKVILIHCESHGIEWMNPKTYGDQWTPLMAATVGNRHEVAEILIQAMEFKRKVEGGTRMASFLNAKNRYGQTALHIAAKMGNEWFLHHLLKAGASPSEFDNHGCTPKVVARRSGHSNLCRLFKS